MLERLRKSLERASIEDKIVFFRFMVGLFYGIGVYASSLFINHLELSRYAWALSIIVYYFTVLFVSALYNPKSRFQLYLRGLATYYGTWLLTAILLSDLLKSIGVAS
jgi:hypothetical protein